MTTSKVGYKGSSVTHYHAEVPFLKQPKVKLVGEYYEDDQGKKYIPELFDKFFKAVKTEIKSKFYKGALIGDNWVD